MKWDNASIIRTVIFIVTWANQFLAFMGKSPLPFNEYDAELVVSGFLTLVSSLIAWWKNNYVGPKGKKQATVLERHNLK